MIPLPIKPQKGTCSSCVHLKACQLWNNSDLALTSAKGCPAYAPDEKYREQKKKQEDN